MKFLKHDINRNLLILIVFFLLLFIFYTVYYENILRTVLTKKSDYDQNYSEFTAQAIMEKLNKTDKLKELAIIDKALLEEKYYELLVKNDKLRKDKESLANEVVLLKSKLEYSKSKDEGPTAQFRLIQDKNQQIKDLKDRLETLCTRLKNLNYEAQECE